jgi:hypothetical protein
MLKPFVRRFIVKNLPHLCLLVILLMPPASRCTAQETNQDTLREIRRQIEILTQEIENMKLGEVTEKEYEAKLGFGPAAGTVYRSKKKGVSLAGYGELVYQNYSKKRQDGTQANADNRIDYLRNVLYVGFRFNDWIVFNSELEFEHSSTGEGAEEKGEASVEFGYVDLALSENLNLRAGKLLLPVGILNEKHEPPTFFGTLRPQVEQYIIPTTWAGIGVGAYGEVLPGLRYRAYIVEGLDATGFSADQGIREGRQESSNAIAENVGLTGRIECVAFPGATLGASFYVGNSGQGPPDTSVRTLLTCLHGEYSWKGFELRALYAQVNIDQADLASALTGEAVGSSLNGWYVVAGYDLIPILIPRSTHYLAPFIQYERLNTQASLPSGYTADGSNNRSRLAFGFSYKPHPNVAFKFDYMKNSNRASTGLNQWNIAVDYLF